jgi:hypothetical protein
MALKAHQNKSVAQKISNFRSKKVLPDHNTEKLKATNKSILFALQQERPTTYHVL